MKDIQKEFEDFWKSYKHFPIAGRHVWLCMCIHVHICITVYLYTYLLYIHLFSAIITPKSLLVLCREELHPLKPMPTDIWHVHH